MLDILKSMLDHSTERMKQPFLGAFTFSLAICNWDVFYYLYASKSDALTKISYVKSTYHFGWDFAFPLVVSLLFLYFPIYINTHRQKKYEEKKSEIESIRLERQRERSSIRQEIADNKAREQYALRRIEKEHENNMAFVRQENKDLAVKVESMQRAIEVNEENLDRISQANDELNKSNNKKNSMIDELKDKVESLSKVSNEKSKQLDSLSRHSAIGIPLDNQLTLSSYEKT